MELHPDPSQLPIEEPFRYTQMRPPAHLRMYRVSEILALADIPDRLTGGTDAFVVIDPEIDVPRYAWAEDGTPLFWIPPCTGWKEVIKLLARTFGDYRAKEAWLSWKHRFALEEG